MKHGLQTIDISIESLSWDKLIIAAGSGGVSPTPTVQPFLWTIFFKVDGTTLTVTDDGKLFGEVATYPSYGSHGTLGWDEIALGGSIAVPESIGRWTSTVVPIPVAPSLQNRVGEDLPAIVGVVAVALVDGGHIPMHAIEHGHSVLNDSVKGALNKLVMQLGPLHQEITPADIDSLTGDVSKTVTDAITSSLSFFEGLWALTGKDYLIGYATLHWTQDTLPADGSPKTFQAVIGPFYNEWSFHGYASASTSCPAEAVAAALGSFIGMGEGVPAAAEMYRRSDPLGAMREFRDEGGMAMYSGLIYWWQAVTKHTPDIVRLLHRSPKLRRSTTLILGQLRDVLRNRDAKTPEKFLAEIEFSLSLLEEQGKASLRPLARHAHAVAREVAGCTVDAALRHIGSRMPRKLPGDRNEHSGGEPPSRAQ